MITLFQCFSYIRTELCKLISKLNEIDRNGRIFFPPSTCTFAPFLYIHLWDQTSIRYQSIIKLHRRVICIWFPCKFFIFHFQSCLSMRIPMHLLPLDLLLLWVQSNPLIHIVSAMKFGLIWRKISLEATAQNVRIEEGTCNTTLNQNQSTVSLHFTKAEEPLEELVNYRSLPNNCPCGVMKSVNELFQKEYDRSLWDHRMDGKNIWSFQPGPRKKRNKVFSMLLLVWQSFSLLTSHALSVVLRCKR